MSFCQSNCYKEQYIIFKHFKTIKFSQKVLIKGFNIVVRSERRCPKRCTHLVDAKMGRKHGRKKKKNNGGTVQVHPQQQHEQQQSHFNQPQQQQESQ